MIMKISDQDLLVVHDHPLHEDHAPGPSPVTEEGPDPGNFLFLSMKLMLELLLDFVTFLGPKFDTIILFQVW